MRMIPTLLTLTALMLTRTAVVAAEHEKPNGEHPKHGEGKPGEGPKGAPGSLEMIEQLGRFAEAKDDDKEVAGKLTELEARLKEKRPEEFAKLDANSDGHLSREELKAALEKALAKFKAERPEVFADIDTNKDGRLSGDEIRAARERRKKDDDRGERKDDRKDDKGDHRDHDDKGGGLGPEKP